MRKWSSLAVASVVLLASPVAALADTPPDIYMDFAEDGVLKCGYSRSALKGTLSDASIYQYGDPLTFIGLKLAVRKQLAGGCRRNDKSTDFFGRAPTGSSEAGSSSESGAVAKSSRRSRTGQGKPERPPTPEPSVRAEALPDRQDGRMVFLGVVLLLVTLGSGGWAARRAFTDDE